MPITSATSRRPRREPAAEPPVEPPPPPRDEPPRRDETAARAESAPAARGKALPGPESATGATSVTREMPKFPAKRPSHKPGTARGAPDSPSATREMPQFASTKRRAPPPVGTPQIARTERRTADPAPAARAAAKQPARIAPPPAVDAVREQVIADAVRLVQWGRKWYELAELISRMADRPPLPEVRRILKDNKTAIEKKAGGG